MARNGGKVLHNKAVYNTGKKPHPASAHKISKPFFNANFTDSLKKLYLSHFNKLVAFLVVLVFFSIGSIAYNYIKTGDFVQKDVSLSGGISITVHTDKDIDAAELDKELAAKFPDSSINVRSLQVSGKLRGITIEDSNPNDEKEIISLIEGKAGKLNKDNISVETMGSSLGRSFFTEMFIAVFFSFICMGLVFQFYFRNLFATSAALLSAFLDIFITLGIIVLLGVKLTSGGIASFLMLIGYSIDTSILISTKMIKEKRDDVNEGLFSAMSTGLTMSAAGIAAMGISYFLSNNYVLKQIMLILVVGLVIDLITTWVGNVAILRLYLNKRKNQSK
ncbi:MAG: hypothetical protein V1859_00815 [archaeon]